MTGRQGTRREFLAGSALTAGSLCFPSAAGAAETGEQPPNIVLILSDDQGWGDYGFMGHPQIRTPHLDRLAGESVTFTRGYVAAPLCCPSLASMITGLHPHQHGRTSNDPPRLNGSRAWTPDRLALRQRMIEDIAQAETLPRLLRERGYVSMQTGKWWEGNHRLGGFTHGMTHGDPGRGGRHGDAGLAIGRQTMQPALDFVDQAVADETPFLLWYAPMMPHSPHNPPDRLFAKYKGKTPSPHVARYWAMCEWFDETCGVLLDYLDDKGLRDNTLVLYICDNGWVQRSNSHLPTPRSKGSSYEGGIRTPIMVRRSGHVRPRRDDSHLACAVDLVPTVLAACGLPVAAAMQGVDLLDRAAVEARNAIFGATYTHDAVDVADPKANLRARWIVEARWKLILPYRPNRPADAVELFDVVADPWETENLAVANRDVVDRLRARIETWWPLHDRLPVRYPSPPPATIDFDFRADLHGWSGARQVGPLSLTEEGLAFDTKGNDPIVVVAPCAIDPEPIRAVRVRLAVEAGTYAEFRWGTEDTRRIDPGKEQRVPLAPGGGFQEVVFPVAEHEQWRGDTIVRLRFDPCEVPGRVRIAWMRAE